MDSITADANYVSSGSAARTSSGIADATGVHGNGIEFDAAGDYMWFDDTFFNGVSGMFSIWAKSAGTGVPSDKEFLFESNTSFNVYYNTSGQVVFDNNGDDPFDRTTPMTGSGTGS